MKFHSPVIQHLVDSGASACGETLIVVDSSDTHSLRASLLSSQLTRDVYQENQGKPGRSSKMTVDLKTGMQIDVRMFAYLFVFKLRICKL